MKITYEPITNSLKEKLSAEEFEHFLNLHQKAQTNPVGARYEIESLYFKYPDIPEIANLYCFVLLSSREIGKAEDLIKNTFLKHPDYLFAKINYGDQCLRKKETDKIPEIFGSVFDLEKLYPDKELFHYSECRGFWVLLAHYFLAINNRKKAEEYYLRAYEIDPAHLSLLSIEKKLYPGRTLIKKVFKFMKVKQFSLRKNRHHFFQIATLYQRKKKHLSSLPKEELQQVLVSWQRAIMNKNLEKANELAAKGDDLAKIHLRKTPFEKGRDFTVAIVIALAFAVLIRTMWFELYEIPSGSMRPTFREQDRLVVSKTDFGVNIPLSTGHFYFDPSLVKRSGIVIFTGKNMEMRDGDTLYFYLFPGKKQYVKRLIGKPGDTLFFYGGQIYGLDNEGNDISHELQLPELANIDHIPFIRFEGNISYLGLNKEGVISPISFSQTSQPVAKLWVNPMRQVIGEMFPVDGQLAVPDYGDLWGFNNYGMVRLLNKEELKHFTNQDPLVFGDGMLYLEIRHHPSIKTAKLIRDETGYLRPALGVTTSYLPLREKELNTLRENLYTARFVVTNGLAHRYGMKLKNNEQNLSLPKLPGIPDGTYEFYDGKGYEVRWQGILTELPSDHPLLQFDMSRLQTLFNMGMEFHNRFSPEAKEHSLPPSRYAYFRSGDLYVMGAPLLKKEDPLLLEFLDREKHRKAPIFQDAGAPFLSDGSLDKDKIRRYGMVIPPKMYFVLGDNHAMSADSRDFGFVPEANLRGGPDFIFWPPGSRFGEPTQAAYKLYTTPRIAIWICAALGFGGWYLWHRRRTKLPLDL